MEPEPSDLPTTDNVGLPSLGIKVHVTGECDASMLQDRTSSVCYADSCPILKWLKAGGHQTTDQWSANETD